MEMTWLDRSNYFRGLLLLVRLDKKITKDETSMIMKIGKRLGFAYEFCNGALKDILENEYILDEPPKFSNKGVAQEFVRDGIKLAVIDNDIDLKEMEWIDSVVRENDLEKGWHRTEVKNINKSLEAEINYIENA